ncbi:zinc finger BED domain-containing 4-like isoform X2 [Brachionus plicatilis]|uniref:Zinc finger BED domain-containing 4-like isoform X2 n=1 Tax=Brachionus plicatilis TaxID=10195 RepID=A0A3M7PI10_BRAPC|nr:zinc finger BED domain-containing 4-like isoform X2 [Brachionus plicatilis]
MSSNFIDSNPQMVSPVLKRRNESFVWQYMKKYENKIVCQVINCSAEFSIKTSSSSLAVYLANIHGIHETGIEDNSGETTCPKSSRKYFCDQNKISELFIDFVVSNIQTFSIADDTKFRKFIFSLNPRFVLPDRKTVREMIKRKLVMPVRFLTGRPTLDRLFDFYQIAK